MDGSLEEHLNETLNLRDFLSNCNGHSERLDNIRKFVEKMSAAQVSIGDFKVGLEWFNCMEPLSLGRQLRGKVVILDFFTYCCINCLHILPHLRRLEDRYSVQDGVVIIGVHSAKFDNEKDSENISAALRKYNILHPVVNDSQGELWSRLGISCWPTLLVLGPKAQPLFQLVGEFEEQQLSEFVDVALDFFRARDQLSHHSLPLSTERSVHQGPLLFPGKVASILQADGSELLAISNSGLHTIIVASAQGFIKHVIGCAGQPGFLDGDFNSAMFNAPQGISFYSNDILFVADTENHAIRKIDLKNRNVVTVAGNLTQSFNSEGGVIVPPEGLSSPWDLCMIRRKIQSLKSPEPFLCICPPAPPGFTGPLERSTSDIAPSSPPLSLPPPLSILRPALVPPPPPPPLSALTSMHMPSAPPPPPVPVIDEKREDLVEQEVLMIAMAGSHQIWAYFFQDTMWWGKEFFRAGTCVNVAGSGHEANRNNSYPRSAAFAQPSGLTYCPESDELFIADSESSSVRSIEMKTGKVSAIVGGSKLPDDLFSFGDRDGNGYNAKLQHPLGITWHEKCKSLYVADSYNHKIKVINLREKTCLSLIGTGHAGDSLSGLKSNLNEPGGLCGSSAKQKLFIADTNNHSIKVFDLTTSSMIRLNLQDPEEIQTPDSPSTAIPLQVRCNGKILLHVQTLLPEQTVLTAGAPQRWDLKLPNSSWKSNSTSGTYNPLTSLELELKTPATQEQVEGSNILVLSTRLYVCTEGTCKLLKSSLSFSFTFCDNVPSVLNYNATFVFAER